MKTHNEAVDKKFNEEEISQISLVCEREGAENASRSAVKDKGFALCE